MELLQPQQMGIVVQKLIAENLFVAVRTNDCACMCERNLVTTGPVYIHILYL